MFVDKKKRDRLVEAAIHVLKDVKGGVSFEAAVQWQRRRGAIHHAEVLEFQDLARKTIMASRLAQR